MRRLFNIAHCPATGAAPMAWLGAAVAASHGFLSRLDAWLTAKRLAPLMALAAPSAPMAVGV
jgi:hypothetical protein